MIAAYLSVSLTLLLSIYHQAMNALEPETTLARCARSEQSGKNGLLGFAMKSMSAKEAKNGFGLLLDTARAEPVTITANSF